MTKEQEKSGTYKPSGRINRLGKDIQDRQDITNQIINVYLQVTKEIVKLEKRIKALEDGNHNTGR